MYLTRDITGLYSGIIYGEKGDQVTIIDDKDREMILVQGQRERFHVRREDMSEEKVGREKPVVEPVKKMETKKRKK